MTLRLDLRGLAAPEPMERILDALQALPRGQCLVALTPMYPAHLLPILDAWGMAYRASADDAGTARIAICHADDAALLEAHAPP